MPGRRWQRGHARQLTAAVLSCAAALLLATDAHAICTGGGLGLTAPDTLTFPATTLTGNNQSVTTTLPLTAHDRTATGTGWRLTGTSTTLTTGVYSLATTATQVTSATRTAGTGNCAMPANSVAYPLTLPAGTTAPAAVTLVRAASGAYSGTGPINIDLGLAITVPGNARPGTYTSTWTLTMVSGP